MSREKQISEIAKIIIEYEDCGDCESCIHKDCCGENRIATNLYNAGYRKQSEIIRCKDCNYFREYSSEYARTTEGADGDCHIRIMNSNNEQYFACQYDDFCSYGKMKGGAE